MRWLFNNVILLLVYGAFIIAGALYLRGWLKYRGIESWPSVNAENVREGGSLDWIPSNGRYPTRIDSRFVEFQYSVDGQNYKSTNATPDGGGLPMSIIGEPPQAFRAFYKPSSPGIAVLSPTPYRGVGLMVTAAVSGILVLAHVWCGVADMLNDKQEAESGSGE